MKTFNLSSLMVWCFCVFGFIQHATAQLQVGATCQQALTASTTSSYEQPTTEGWLQFTASHPNLVITLNRPNASDPVAVHGCTVYSGSCNGLTPLTSDVLSDASDPQLNLSLNGLQTGVTYYIKCDKLNFNTNCSSCNGDIAVFDMRISPRVENCTVAYDVYVQNPSGSLVSIQSGQVNSQTSPLLPAVLPNICPNTVLTLTFTSGINGSSTNFFAVITDGTNTYFFNNLSANTPNSISIPLNTFSNSPSGTYQMVVAQTSFTGAPFDGCAYFVFDLYPTPSTAFSVVPNPVCGTGIPVCFSTTSNTVYPTSNDFYQNFQPLNNPISTLLNGSYFPFLQSAGGTSCVPVSTFSNGLNTVLLAAYYNFGLVPFVYSCLAVGSQSLYVYPPIGNVSINANATSICTNGLVNLSAVVSPSDNITVYNWQPGNLSGAAITVSPSLSTTYTLTVINANGCTKKAVVSIAVQECCSPTQLANLLTLTNCTLVANNSVGAISWAAFSAATTATNALIALPATGVLTGNFFIRGHLILNANATINQSRVVFDEAATLVQNANLAIDRCYFNGCNKNWKGISSNGVLNITNSVIEDAQHAISSPAGGTHQGLTLVNVFFNKNLNGLNFQGKVFTSFQLRECVFTCRAIASGLYNYTSGALWRTTANFSHTGLNQFGQATLLGSPLLGIFSTQRSQTGILGLGVSMSNTATGLIVGTSNPAAGSAYSNLFDLMPVGTAMFYSQMDYYHNRFQNIRHIAAFQDQYGSLSAAIYQEGCRSLVGTYPAIIGSVYGNTVVSSDYGVRAITNGSLNVSHSNFDGVFTGVFISKWYGSASNNYTNTVNYNSFNNCVIDVNTFDNKKINLSINSNVATWSSTGRQPSTYNVAMAELSKNAACKVEVINNVFSGKNKVGVYSNTNMGLTIESNSITMASPLSNQFAGNIWLDNTDDSKIRYNQLNYAAGNTNNWLTFGLFTASGLNNQYCSNTTQGASVCMKFQGNCPSKIYSNVLSPNSSNPSQIGINLDATGFIGNVNYISAGSATVCAENQFGNFGYADTYSQNGSQGQRIDYSGLANANNPFFPAVNIAATINEIPFVPVPNSSAGIVNCGSSQSPQSIHAENQEAMRAVAPTVNSSNSNAVFTPVTVEVAEKVAYDLIKQKNLDPTKISGGVQFVNTQNNQANGKFYKADSLIVAYTKTKSSQTLQMAKNQNNQASVGNDVDNHQKIYNLIYLAYLDSSMSETHIATLKILAQLCPFTDGNSVYQSRALLKAYDTTDYRNACETALPALPQSGSRLFNANPTRGNEAVAIGTEVFPNPATTELNITTNLSEAVFTLQNVLGQVLMQTKLNSLTKLDVSNLKNGTYLYTISKEKTIVKTNKLIITK